ncbi:MAG: tripartite tricarboxylate transporter substrate binding protein [Burkholderiales bacterium]
MTTRFRLFILALAALIASAGAFAQGYPTKPIRLIVPFAPGGGTDMIARSIAQRLGEAWAQPVVVDHRPGGTGAVGSVVVAQSAPDGYTLIIVTSSTHAIAPNLHRKPLYDPVRDFAPVSLAASAPEIVVAHASVPATSIKELVALAKAKPGTLNYASPGTGTIGHMTGELFKLVTGANIVHIPYKGAGAAIREVLGAQVQIMFSAPAAVIPHVRSGKLRALAAATHERLPELKEIPTLAELGYPAVEASNWYGVLAPAGTPRSIIEKLNREIVKTMQISEVKEALFKQGYDAVSTTPEQFGKLIRDDFQKWKKVVSASGMQIE